MRSSRLRLAAFWLFAGSMHFARAREYEATVPDYVPISSRNAVRWSGYAELAGGLMAIPRPTRRLARWWLIGLLIAVFPANVHMALHPEEFPDVPGGRTSLYARLPFQGVFVAWVASAMRR